MSTPIRLLRAAVTKLRQNLDRRAKATQRALDAFLSMATQNKTLSWKDAFSYAKCVIIFSLLRFEVHVAAITIFAIVIGTGIFIPFGTADISTRLSLVIAAMITGTTLSFFLLYLLLSLHIRHQLRLWLILLIHSLVCAVIFCLIEPEIIRHFQSYPVPEFSDIFIPILLLYVIADLFVLWHLNGYICVQGYREKHKAKHIEALLPAEKRGEVWLMSAADHYVEFITAQGSHLRRMTMKAAVERACPDEGMQVHRSHWVAYKAMLSLEKDGERFFLTLRSGQRVPVSPKALPVVQCELSPDCVRAAE